MKKTIRQAVVEAFKIKTKPMTPKEVYQTIIEHNLYTFNAKSPQSLVTSELRKHCDGLNLKTSRPEKFFTFMNDGTYYLKG